MDSGGNASDSEQARLEHLFTRQREGFAADPYPSARARRAQLRALCSGLANGRDRLVEAISADFGGRASFESLLADVLGPTLAARHAIGQLGRWMRPRRRHTELLFATNQAWVMYQPKGVVGIVTPWNFPVYLALGPLVAALAAGNRALIKMSEYTPATTSALREVLDACLGADAVPVIGGDVGVARAFTALPFDHLIFTGSPAVAPEVMGTAARALVPVTLELGGKSPVIVARGADVAATAASVAHGKTFNAGQICVSPDYALVPTEDVDRFAAAMLAAAERLYPSVDTPDYTSIITARQHERLVAILEDARASGATVRSAGSGAGRRMPLHVVTGVTDTMRVAREELFGPILPIIGYERLEDAIDYVTKRPRPLALYPFGFGQRELQTILTHTHAGGVTVGDWGWHVFNHDLPFGGIGPSGMGSYHGVEGFQALSHTKAVLRRHRYFPVALFRPPYGRWVQRLVLRFYLGR
jgi:coniferyl-aldehyde dehydrogenase